MPDLCIVDTDVLIDVARGVGEAITYLEQLEQQFSVAMSAVTQMELIVGCRNRAELRALDRFLRRFVLAPLSELVSDVAVDLLQRYRLSHRLLIADALVAATAIVLNAPLSTKNQRDYSFIGGLRILGHTQPLDT